jgi:hypothetical protein
MSLREHLRHLVTHVEWWGIEWLYHHYREVLGSVMLAALGATAQKLQGIPYDWWVLSILFFGCLGLLVYFHKRDRRREVVVPLPVKTTEEGPQSPIPAVVFIVRQVYVNPPSRADVPLRLWVNWANEGEEVHLGKPQWIADRIAGQYGTQGLRYQYKVDAEHGKRHTECDEVTAKHGYTGQLWLGLDPLVKFNDVDLWRRSTLLGTLVLPFTFREIMMEVRIRL